MKILARKRSSEGGVYSELFHLQVSSNPLGALHLGNSITIYGNDMGDGYGTWSESYKTISDFLDEWEILGSRQIQIPAPFIKDKVGLGTVAGKFFAFFHVYPTENCGCPDRKTWWNWLLAFVPFGYKEPGSTAESENA